MNPYKNRRLSHETRAIPDIHRRTTGSRTASECAVVRPLDRRLVDIMEGKSDSSIGLQSRTDCPYTSVGAIAGYAGANLSSTFLTTLPIQSILIDRRRIVDRPRSICSRILRRATTIGQHHVCCRDSERLLASTRVHQCLLCRRIHWISPCGLVYAFLACLLHYEHDRRWLTMFAFGLGTMPILIVTGLGGVVDTRHAPPSSSACRLLRATGWSAFPGAWRRVSKLNYRGAGDEWK